ncbi:MAG TPA: class I SAM-dependent methyltransferase [Gemmatimonadaceae bacterium]|nr:class I SAM-dependent methyltransferase [Gemmatimonadaceae bacterium]
MFSESAELYDAIYATFKDYAAESLRVAELVRGVHPNPRTILDTACGTGEHVKHLRRSHRFVVDGLDIDQAMLAVARRKVPEASFFEADMSSFALDKSYDAVLCLFSSIGYLRTLDRVTAALDCFRQHLNEGGVVVVEPWFAPGVLQPGRRDVKQADVGATHVERSSAIAVEDRLSTIIFEYKITGGGNAAFAREEHKLGLFTPEETLECFRAAGLNATWDPQGLIGRGLFVARIR